jgi:integrase/recombinase XerD
MRVEKQQADGMVFERELRRFVTFIRLEKGLSANSIEAYSRDLERYLQFLSQAAGIQSLDGASVQHMENYLEELSALGLATSSIARALSSIRSFHSFCVAEGICESNPAEVIDLPKKARHLPEVLTVEEIMKMIQVHDNETLVGKRSVAILELLYATGIRVSELCGLTIDRLFFEIGYIRVIGKGNKERIVPIGDFAIKAMTHWLETGRPSLLKRPEQARQAVFLNQRGTPLSRMSVWNLVDESARLAGIEKPVHPHIFRHSCATHMLEGGADLVSVQEILGHASILTTEIYTHVDRSLLQQTHKMYHPRA